MSAETTAPKREDGMPVGQQFKAGNPGRPKGSRNKLGEMFLEALHDDFKEHGIAAIEKVRDTKPDQYLKVIASLMPKELNLNFNDDNAELSDDELIQRIRTLSEAIAPLVAGGAGIAPENAGRPSGPEQSSRVH